MKFSLRLTADLALALAARAIGDEHGSSPILHLSPENNFDCPSAPSSTRSLQSRDALFHSVARVSRYRSPIIWIGGSEPLDHPQAARFSNALAASGRHVFVETSGTSLKRRLHEFRPSSRFYFAVRFEGHGPSNGRPSSGDNAFRVGLEAIRMARLAGFFTCANLIVHPDTTVSGIAELHVQISKLDVDGFLITARTLSPELLGQVSQLRRRLLSRRWALLSSMLDSSIVPATSRDSADSSRPPLPEPQQESVEESVEA